MEKPLKKGLAILAGAAAVMLFAVILDRYAAMPDTSPTLVPLVRVLSHMGNGVFLLAVAAAFYLAGRKYNSEDLKAAGREAAIAVVAAGVAVQFLKLAFERLRPSAASTDVLQFVTDPFIYDTTGRFNSFPSGHTTVAFAAAYVLGRRLPVYKPLFYCVASLVAISRVYLGSHYPTDVAGGAFLGMAVGYAALKETSWEKRAAMMLAFAAVFISFFKPGGFLLFDVDEAVFSEASREMVETWNVLTPTYNYEPRFDKPILFYWLQSAAFLLAGVSELSARFMPGAFAAMTVLSTFFFMRKVTGELKVSLMAALMLLLNAEYFVYSHSAVTDATLMFFITASAYSFYMSVREESAAWRSAFWALAALATLTKGAIGLLFPVGIAVIYLVLAGEMRHFRPLFSPRNVGVYVLIASPWFIVQLALNGRDFFDAFIMKHHVQRFTGVVSSHGGPFYYYVPVVALAFFPWAAMLPAALYRGFVQWRAKSGGLYLFATIWFLLVFVFFSIGSTKLPNYILPLLPPASLLAGMYAANLRPHEKSSGLAIIIIMGCLMASAAILLPSMEMKMPVELSPRVFFVLGAVFLASALFAFTAYVKPTYSVAALMAVAAFLLAFLRLAVVPPVNAYLQKDIYVYARYARGLGPGAMLAAYEVNKPSLAFYYGAKVPRIDKRTTCDIKEFAKGRTLLVLTEEGRLDELKDENLSVIDSRGGYALLASSPGALPPVPR